MFADRETIGGRAVALLLLVGSTVVSSAAIKDKIFPVQRLQRRIVSLSEADDKYKSPPQPPLLWVETPESLIEIGHLSCNKTKELNDKIVAEVTPETATWENVFLPMVVEGNEMTFKENPAYFYQYVGLTAELRDASVEASTIMDECGVEESMRQDVFALVDAVYQKRDSLGLDPESLRFVEKSYLGYIDSGLGLPADKRARFKEISSRMNDLETQYSQNINNANGGVWLTPEQLKGTPENVLEGLEKGTGDNEGKMKLTWEYTDYYPFQSHALDPKARLEAYLGYENRVSLLKYPI
jgi:metallopeptidase MepB